MENNMVTSYSVYTNRARLKITLNFKNTFHFP